MAPSGTSVDGGGNIVDRPSMGRGLALIPNLDADAPSGSKILVQTSFQHANTPFISGLPDLNWKNFSGGPDI